MKVSVKLPKQGFTLLEVMVALAILAVAAIALMNVGMNYTNGLGRMQDRTYGHFVAMNELASLEINASWPEGTGEKEVEEQGRHWSVAWKVSNTMSEQVGRIEISVIPVIDGKKADAPVTHLTAFLHYPVSSY